MVQVHPRPPQSFWPRAAWPREEMVKIIVVVAPARSESGGGDSLPPPAELEKGHRTMTRKILGTSVYVLSAILVLAAVMAGIGLVWPK